jgi:hypothetical protein
VAAPAVVAAEQVKRDETEFDRLDRTYRNLARARLKRLVTRDGVDPKTAEHDVAGWLLVRVLADEKLMRYLGDGESAAGWVASLVSSQVSEDDLAARIWDGPHWRALAVGASKPKRRTRAPLKVEKMLGTIDAVACPEVLRVYAHIGDRAPRSRRVAAASSRDGPRRDDDDPHDVVGEAAA